MGEWAVTLEAASIRPGAVTFVIHNGGTRTHGFRIRSQSEGGGERFEARTELIAPGNNAELTVELASGTYEASCYVEEAGIGEHDQLGMQTSLTVREDAPLTSAQPAVSEAALSIQQFAFAPTVLEMRVRDPVVWTNNDPTEHTVSAEDGSFDSGLLPPGGTFSQVFSSPGTYLYLCKVHPTMRGRIEVRG